MGNVQDERGVEAASTELSRRMGERSTAVVARVER